MPSRRLLQEEEESQGREDRVLVVLLQAMYISFVYHTNPQFKTFRQILVLKLLVLYVRLTDVSSLVRSSTISHWGPTRIRIIRMLFMLAKRYVVGEKV